MDRTVSPHHEQPWNKGKLVGQKPPLRVKDIWAIRVRLQMQGRIRDLALFDLGIDSKLRASWKVKCPTGLDQRFRSAANGHDTF
jgi:hypothetical protein